MGVPAIRLNDEAGRLAALRRYEIVDTGPEQEFTDIVDLVKAVFDVPFAAVNLIDQNRQWMAAAAGLEPFECKREDAFCDRTIRGTAALMIPDARRDPRFASNPFVTGEAGIRAYLGTPLMSPDGYNIGALCVFDTVPRSFTPAQSALLGNFARVVMSMLELRLVARVDGLTGVLTRRAFTDRLDRALSEDGRHCLILLDLDHFKQVNDSHGHPVGDEVLRRTAATIQSTIRKSDAFGRMGGEEFGVLLSDVSMAEAMQTAERVRQAVAATALPVLGGHAVTLSIGLAALLPEESRTAWLERADVALYQAKRSGRNRCIPATGLAA